MKYKIFMSALLFAGSGMAHAERVYTNDLNWQLIEKVQEAFQRSGGLLDGPLGGFLTGKSCTVTLEYSDRDLSLSVGNIGKPKRGVDRASFGLITVSDQSKVVTLKNTKDKIEATMASGQKMAIDLDSAGKIKSIEVTGAAVNSADGKVEFNGKRSCKVELKAPAASGESPSQAEELPEGSHQQ